MPIKHLDVKREAARWVSSLTSPSEGYIIIVAMDSFVSLRHRSNGNWIRIYIRDSKAELWKNGVCIKTYPNPYDDEPALF